MSQEATFPCEKGWAGEGWCEYKSQWSCTTDSVLHCAEKSGGSVYSICYFDSEMNRHVLCYNKKAEITRIWINKIHATILIILLFCFVFSLFWWKVWEAQYRLLQPMPPQRRQVRWDIKNLSLKIDAGKITEQQKGKIRCQFFLRWGDWMWDFRFSEACPLCVVDGLLQMAS